MTIESLKERIGEMEAELADIKQDVKDFENSWPTEGDTVWSVDSAFEPMKWLFTEDATFHEDNIFQTEEEAQQRCNVLAACSRLFAQVKSLGTGGYYPMIDTNGEPTWSYSASNPFGCKDKTDAKRIAESDDFKVFLAAGAK